MKPGALLLPASLALLGYACLADPAKAKSPTRAVSDDRDVRPIISQRCFKCHGPDVAKAAAGLRLDSLEAASKVLGDGRAIAPGDPAHSLLLQRVAEKDPDNRMPPPGNGAALTPAEIQTLTEWIKSGAKYEKHWSFVPPTLPKLPVTKNKTWPKNDLDRFVLAKLESAHLVPEPEADRDTLALRAAQTLTGLPPTPAELSQFRKDKKPGAYERYVDRLLAKPTYGEHQARYWLDAVRYGDTHGLQLDNERGIFPFRDWVIRAYNQDLPFNKFVEWQLAGDLLPNPTTEQLIATGYVRMNLTTNEGGAIAEEFLARNTFDRVDTTATVMLGLTVGCAKCHDHKYDPIPTRDYYGLYAYFDSTQDEPLDGNIALPPPYIAAPTPEQAAEQRLLNSQIAEKLKQVAPEAAAKWLAAHRDPIPTNHDWQISPVYTEANFDQAFEKPEPPERKEAVTWKPFAYTPGKDAAGIIGKDNSSVYVKGIVSLEAPASLTLRVSSDDAIKLWVNGKLVHANKITRGLVDGVDVVKAKFNKGDNEILAKVTNGAGPDGLNLRFGSDRDAQIETALAGYKMGNSTAIQVAYLEQGPNTQAALTYRKLARARTELEQAIPMTLIAKERMKPRDTFILKRGQYDQKGDPVQRHIPTALGVLSRSQPNDRLGLARWMVDPQNPLVARVFVNRIWQQHFGTGLVKTAEDFGSQGEWPENQALLDYLAVTFIKNGWSVKKLNRLIVTSAAFRQSSRITPQKLAADPENRLISRGPRFRLDAEVIRDKALQDGGILVEKIGGHGFKPYQPSGLWENTSDPASGTHFYKQDHGEDVYRRSLYIFWKRTSPPPVLVTFDAPLRDTCIVRRSVTNTPLQALIVLNEPAFLEASRTMAARILAQAKTDSQRLTKAFQIAFDREPRSDEAARLLKSLTRYQSRYKQDEQAAKRLLAVGETPRNTRFPESEQAAWMLLCSSLMNTDEFLTQH
jgi:mono/diheme cytochrome c family protein